MTGHDIAALGLPESALKGAVLEPTHKAWAKADEIRGELEQGEAWVKSNGRNGRAAVLDDLDLRPAGEAFANRELIGLSARRVQAVGIDFSGTQLAGANFEGSDLRGANFGGADLRGASFRDARLSHAVFHHAQTGPLPLRDGRSREMQLDGAQTEGTGLRAPARLL
jgi:uncharacterized protein YjbI with pentapeptide repeats